MIITRWIKYLAWVLLVTVAGGSWPTPALAGPPAQRLPSALLVFPYIDTNGGRDTRIELVNLSGDPQLLNCFFVTGDTCNEIGFFISLTPYQPLSWLATEGLSNTFDGSAAPPFFGTGELKCAVVPPRPDDLALYNTMQGRATVFDFDGETVSYGAVAFRRLVAGEFNGLLPLDGITYEQCPDRLHFNVLADTDTSSSQMVLVPCSQDLLTQVPTTIRTSLVVINEFEQSFSSSTTITCFGQNQLGAITDSFKRSILGSDTAHAVVRGTNGPLNGLVIDGVPFAGNFGTAGNEPSFQGGRSATVIFP